MSVLDATRGGFPQLDTPRGVQANFSLGESMHFALDSWGSLTGVTQALEAIHNDAVVFGDVYVRFPVGP